MSDTPTSPVEPTASTTAAAAASSQPDDAAEAARLKREARKARILAKGSDRLARITNTGRGEGASAYLKDNTPSLPSTTPPQPEKPLSVVPGAEDDDPLEVDISTLPRRQPRGQDVGNPFAMFGGGEGPGGGQNPMEALMAMMQGAGGGGGGFGGPGAPGFGAGAAEGGQPDMSGLPPQLAAMMQQFGAAGGGPGGPAAAAPTATQTKSLSERAFDLLQAVLVVALAVLAARSSLFDLDRSSVVPDAVSDTFEKLAPPSTLGATNTLRRWARLGYQKPTPTEWMSVSPTSFLPNTTLPLFWIFLSLELVLQAGRIVIFSRKTPAPPSLLSTLTMMLPIPNLGVAVRLVGKYLALVNALVNDLAVLVFVFGVTVLWSGWRLGGVGMLEAGVVPGFVHDEL